MSNHETVRLVTQGQWKDILATLIGAVPEMTFDEAESVIGNKGAVVEGVRKVFQRLIHGVFHIFHFTVDYTKSLGEMVEAGRYDWVTSNIKAENFPIQGEGQQDKEYVLFHFDRRIFSEGAIRLMAKEKCDPGKIEDICKFGEERPELQSVFPIVGLGSSWHDRHGLRRVPVLRCHGAERHLALLIFEDDWDPRYRFLGVRKSAA